MLQNKRMHLILNKQEQEQDMREEIQRRKRAARDARLVQILQSY